MDKKEYDQIEERANKLQNEAERKCSQKNSRKAGKQECLKNSRKEYNDCGSSQKGE